MQTHIRLQRCTREQSKWKQENSVPSFPSRFYSYDEHDSFQQLDSKAAFFISDPIFGPHISLRVSCRTGSNDPAGKDVSPLGKGGKPCMGAWGRRLLTPKTSSNLHADFTSVPKAWEEQHVQCFLNYYCQPYTGSSQGARAAGSPRNYMIYSYSGVTQQVSSANWCFGLQEKCMFQVQDINKQ